jgi:hypothetical protein
MPELELSPPRPHSALLARTLRRHRLGVFAALVVPALMMVAFVAANLYQHSQGLQSWAWSNLWWFLAALVGLAIPLWLYGRKCFAVIKRAYQYGLLYDAAVEIVHGDRFVGIKARFVVDGQILAITVSQSGSRLKTGDLCWVLYVPSTRETVVVIPDVGIVANVEEPHVAERVVTTL